MSGLQKVAFKKGATGKSFGDLCLRSYELAIWVIDDKKTFTSDQIWTCPGQQCVINHRSGINTFYKNPPGGDSVLLELIPAVEKIHANLYTCQEKHWTDEGSEFPYQVSVYGRPYVGEHVHDQKYDAPKPQYGPFRALVDVRSVERVRLRVLFSVKWVV